MDEPSHLQEEFATKTVFKLDWSDEQIQETAAVTGSVVEFAFGPVNDSYLATSYPHRPEYAVGDKRKVAKQNIPLPVLRKIARLRPRYIMNLAFRPNTSTWFIFCYRDRFGYDAKWEPRKPIRTDKVGATLDKWRVEARDQVSSCAFGDSSGNWFMRSTDSQGEWHPHHGPDVPQELAMTYQEAIRRTKHIQIVKERNGKEHERTTLRAITFGPGNAWILYSKDDFWWSDHGLPESLVQALEVGKQSKGWFINKAVLNPRNKNEYVLVYDHGPVYCSFHHDFQAHFREILKEWSDGMRKGGVEGLYKNHWHEPDYHWYDPNQAELARPENAVFDGEDYSDAADEEGPKSTARSKLKRLGSQNSGSETRSTHTRLPSDQSQKPRPLSQAIQNHDTGLAGIPDVVAGGFHQPGLQSGLEDTGRDHTNTELSLEVQQLRRELEKLKLQMQQQSLPHSHRHGLAASSDDSKWHRSQMSQPTVDDQGRPGPDPSIRLKDDSHGNPSTEKVSSPRKLKLWGSRREDKHQ